MDKPNENHLHLSWYDSAWIPILNQSNVLDYFSERSNPFYDRTCNNEIIKMQRLNVEHLSNMTGLEYILLHVQEPILYVIRKQHRHSPTQVSPLGVYYIIAGIVYQAPDLGSVVNSRLLNTVHNLQSSFEEAQAFSRYHPSKGYWWEFKDRQVKDKPETKEKKKREEPSSLFQRQRVDMLLEELGKKYPPQFVAPPHHDNRDEAAAGGAPRTEVKQEVKIEKVEEKASPAPQSAPPPSNTTPVTGSAAAMKPPPEKKAKIR